MNGQQPAIVPDDFDHWVVKGNASRDAQQWSNAAWCYQQALRLRPTASGIWAQFGQASKESGAFPQAEAAYLKARGLNPGDSGLLVQLGHLWALRDNREKAAAFYREAIRAGADDGHARHYLARYDGHDPAHAVNPAAPLPAIYFEYTDLLSHFSANRNPTGIQRVQIELFRASLAGTQAVPIRACTFVTRLRAWVELDPDDLLELVDLASLPGHFDDRDWRQVIDRVSTAIDSRDPCTFPIGAVLVNLGTSWGLDRYMSAIRDMKTRYGLRYVPFVHDLIPLVTPEFVVPGLAISFNAWFSNAVLHGDLFAATSRSTCNDVVRAAASVRPLATKPIAMPLDASSHAAERASPLQVGQTLQRFGLTAGSFVLFVGTMEVRKNHLLVFQAWARLLERHGRDAVPVLVCVGKPGWKFSPAQAFLDTHLDLEGHIVRLSGISDTELASLYQACLFTVYASLYEGWGLPVTESLCHGKACLTANHSSLPEAGGQFADYYEGDSLKSFIDQAERLLDADYRMSREQSIVAEFRPRRWPAVLTGLVEGIAATFDQPVTPVPFCAPITLGTTYRISQRMFERRLSFHAAVGEMLCLDGKSWYAIDADGLWSNTQKARLAFQVPQLASRAPEAPGADLLVFLKLRAPPEAVAVTIHFAGSVIAAVSLTPRESRIVRLDVPIRLVAADGMAVLELWADHLTRMVQYNVLDDRHVGVCLAMFMACLATDLPARLGVIENAIMTLEDA